MGEKVVFSIVCKILSPCVFCFFYLFGYGQGLKRVRNKRKRVVKRVSSLLLAYFIWASLAWLLFYILGTDFNLINNTKGILIDSPFPLGYLTVIGTFSGSWQYYFIFIFIVSMFFLYFFRNASLKALKVYLYIFSILQILFFLIITIYLWKAPVDLNNLTRLGIIIYANPIAWVLPLFWGYYRAASKQDIVSSRKSPWFFLLLAIVYIASVGEIYYLGERWGMYFIMDQFTLLTLVNSILMIYLYDVLIRGFIKKSKNESLLLSITSRMGRYSIIPFFVHLPYQWFLYILFESITNLNLNPLPAFVVISILGLSLSYFSINLIDKLPIKIKKILMGI